MRAFTAVAILCLGAGVAPSVVLGFSLPFKKLYASLSSVASAVQLLPFFADPSPPPPPPPPPPLSLPKPFLLLRKRRLLTNWSRPSPLQALAWALPPCLIPFTTPRRLFFFFCPSDDPNVSSLSAHVPVRAAGCSSILSSRSTMSSLLVRTSGNCSRDSWIV